MQLATSGIFLPSRIVETFFGLAPPCCARTPRGSGTAPAASWTMGCGASRGNTADTAPSRVAADVKEGVTVAEKTKRSKVELELDRAAALIQAAAHAAMASDEVSLRVATMPIYKAAPPPRAISPPPLADTDSSNDQQGSPPESSSGLVSAPHVSSPGSDTTTVEIRRAQEPACS